VGGGKREKWLDVRFGPQICQLKHLVQSLGDDYAERLSGKVAGNIKGNGSFVQSYGEKEGRNEFGREDVLGRCGDTAEEHPLVSAKVSARKQKREIKG